VQNKTGSSFNGSFFTLFSSMIHFKHPQINFVVLFFKLPTKEESLDLESLALENVPLKDDLDNGKRKSSIRPRMIPFSQ
jgi:hypothetical protein